MIYVLIIGILLSVSAPMETVSDECKAAKQLEDSCGGYCYKAVKPLMDLVVKLQKPEVKPVDAYSTQKVLEMFASVNAQQRKFEESVRSQLSALEGKLARQDERFHQQKASVPKNFDKIGNKYYYINDENEVNWFAAGHRCHELGGHLASIQCEAEYQALLPKLNRKKNYWIDLSDLSQEGLFISQATARKGVYFNWYGNNPDNFGNHEHCVHLWNVNNSLKMNDNTCSANMYFICEYTP